MINRIGERFTDIFKRNMPDSFVFALILTIITALASFIWVGSGFIEILSSWYKGFWILLEFGMQVVLLIITGHCIALSPVMNKGINKYARIVKTPNQVYIFVIIAGVLLSLISWGWIVITAVMARELALRVKGVNYYYLIALVYISSAPWVAGFSSSIPLLLNTEDNFIIKEEILSKTIPVSFTLGNILNYAIIAIFLFLLPLFMLLLKPSASNEIEIQDLLEKSDNGEVVSIEDEANNMRLQTKALSDTMNNSTIIQFIIAAMGLIYIVYYFANYGFALNLNIMIFIFIILGLFLHRTPIRVGIAMKRASSNISGIIFQYPFYAGIMGIMMYSGLGERIADWMASIATIESYPFFAYCTGVLVNFAIPSAGGEFAVVGPSIINAIKEIGIGLPESQVTAMISRAVMSIAYGESISNLLQPFFLLLIIPVMGKGIKVQARDIMGYLVLPFLIFFILESILVVWMPLSY